MKTFKIFLSSLLLSVVAITSLSHPSIIYRWRCYIYALPCYNYGTWYSNGTNSSLPISTTFTLNPGDMINITQYPMCYCNHNPDLNVGLEWEEEQNTDGSWSLVDGMFQHITEGNLVYAESWTNGANGLSWAANLHVCGD